MTRMQIANSDKLKRAEAEVNRAAHDQDLTEVPERARLDREAENRQMVRRDGEGSGTQ